MRDSLGGLTNIVIILVFIVVALGYAAFNVNYTKAFRMKDKIISVYNKYGGNCDRLETLPKYNCQREISDYAQSIGYNASFKNNPPGDGFSGVYDYLYAEKKIVDPSCSSAYTQYSGCCNTYFKIVTKVDLSLPIIDKFMGFNFLYVDGDTDPVCVPVS